MKISIITSVFNAKKTLEQTIISVINQTYTNLEYIVVDGGSTDGSIEIIKKYQDKITKWISEPDNGISDAFNKGISMATGDLIGIINADDWYAPDTVELVVQNLDEKFDIYCGNLELLGKNEEISLYRKSRISWLNFGMYIMHPTVFVKSHVYKKVGLFDIRLKIAMDFDMMLRIKFNRIRFKHIDHKLVYMRSAGASSDVIQMHKEEVIVMKRYLKGLPLLLSLFYNYLNRIYWRFFHNSLLK